VNVTVTGMGSLRPSKKILPPLFEQIRNGLDPMFSMTYSDF